MSKAKRDGTTIAEDMAIVVGTIAFLEALKFAFGPTVALIVALVVLLVIFAFFFGVVCGEDRSGQKAA